MIESWVINDGSTAPVSSAVVLEALRTRIDKGQLETWLTSSSGRSLTIVTNTERAMVMLLNEEGDPGERAVDPGAHGTSEGFVLTNGQHDEYPNEDTVPIGEAFRIVEHIIGNGSWPAAARWVSDRCSGQLSPGPVPCPNLFRKLVRYRPGPQSGMAHGVKVQKTGAVLVAIPPIGKELIHRQGRVRTTARAS